MVSDHDRKTRAHVPAGQFKARCLRLLDEVQRDPADHMIVATARQRRARLVTAAENIAESGLVGVVW